MGTTSTTTFYHWIGSYSFLIQIICVHVSMAIENIESTCKFTVLSSSSTVLT